MKKIPQLFQFQNDMDCVIPLRFLYLACFVVSPHVTFIWVCWILIAYTSSTTCLLTRLPHAGLYNYNRRQIEFFHMKWFFFYLGFPSQPFTNHKTAGERGGHFFNPSLPLPPASQTLGHYPGDYCRELTSVHRQQLESYSEPLISERKSLTTKLRTKKWNGLIVDRLIGSRLMSLWNAWGWCQCTDFPVSLIIT